MVNVEPFHVDMVKNGCQLLTRTSTPGDQNQPGCVRTDIRSSAENSLKTFVQEGPMWLESIRELSDSYMVILLHSTAVTPWFKPICAFWQNAECATG